MNPGKSRLWRLLALLMVLGLFAAACGDDGDDEEVSTGDDETTETTEGEDGEAAGDAKCENVAIGFFGALTGANANLGLNSRNGAKVALKEWNDANKDCQVELKEFDSQGSPDQAPALAQQAVQDSEVIGLLGPAFSGESRTANPIFDQAGLSVITPSATGTDLSTKGWKIFHRAVPNDNAQGPAIVKYLKNELNSKRVAVLDDKSEYGKGIADIIRKDLGALAVVSDSFDDKATEFSSTVNKVKAGNVDAVVFGGYYSQGGPLAKQLKDGGVTAKFIGPDGVNDKGFVEGAGAAAEGAVLTAPADVASADTPEKKEFIDKFKELNNTDVGLYSLEGYDATKIYLECIGKGNTTREKIEACLDSGEFEGVANTYKWDDKGELTSTLIVYAFTVKGGTITSAGAIK